MRNRAKCKKCLSTIESSGDDRVTCSCGEISVSGDFKCSAGNWSNFLRVDDEGNEIVVTVKDREPQAPVSKEDKLEILDEVIKSYERLPPTALSSPASNYDILSLTMLVRSLFS